MLTSLRIAGFDSSEVLGEEGRSYELSLARLPRLAEFALEGDGTNTYCPPPELTRLSRLRRAAACLPLGACQRWLPRCC